MIYDCIIVGAGPAGIVAAVQLKRSGWDVLLLERDRVGGVLLNARLVSNYLAFPGGISGARLAETFQAQLKEHDAKIVHAEVQRIAGCDPIHVVTERGVYSSRAVIIATGTKPKKAGIDGEDVLAGTKVFYHVAYLPQIHAGAKVIVIGGGDIGFDYALRLADSGLMPIILTRGEVRCIPVLQKEILHRNILCLPQEVPRRFRMQGGKAVVECDNHFYEADYILIAAGREPNLPPCDPHTRGVFVAGDAHGGVYRQVHIAAGDALRTAMEVNEFLEGEADKAGKASKAGMASTLYNKKVV